MICYHFTWPSPDVLTVQPAECFEDGKLNSLLVWQRHAHLSDRDAAQVPCSSSEVGYSMQAMAASFDALPSG